TDANKLNGLGAARSDLALFFAGRYVIASPGSSARDRRTPGDGRPASEAKRKDAENMGNYLAAIWRCRFFWLSLVKLDLRTRYRRSILGMGWSLLHPVAMTIIICLVFRKLLHAEV